MSAGMWRYYADRDGDRARWPAAFCSRTGCDRRVGRCARSRHGTPTATRGSGNAGFADASPTFIGAGRLGAQRAARLFRSAIVDRRPGGAC